MSADLKAISEQLEKTLQARLKSDAVKQEVDRNEDLIRSALRAVDSLHRLPDAATDAAFTGFMSKARALCVCVCVCVRACVLSYIYGDQCELALAHPMLTIVAYEL